MEAQDGQTSDGTALAGEKSASASQDQPRPHSVGGRHPSRAPCVPIPEDPSLQGALSTQQGDTGRNELDSGLMLITGFQFPGLKRDSSHSSAFICVILVQNETKTETSHFTSHFGVFQLRPAPVGVIISWNAPTSRRQLQAVPQCRAGDEAGYS